MEHFGERLENLREKKNLNKKDVSLKLGFSANVYGSYERGERRPSFETLIKLADMYDVTVDYLLRGTLPKSSIEQSSFQTKLIDILEKYNIHDLTLLDLDKWQTLSKSDIEEINQHFEWVVERAKRTD